MEQFLADVAPQPDELAPWAVGGLAICLIVVAIVGIAVALLVRRSRRK